MGYFGQKLMGYGILRPPPPPPNGASFPVHSNDDECISFPLNADFPAFSYRILRQTSRNLSDERLKHLHVNVIQCESDAELTRQLINIRSLVKTQSIAIELT